MGETRQKGVRGFHKRCFEDFFAGGNAAVKTRSRRSDPSPTNAVGLDRRRFAFAGWRHGTVVISSPTARTKLRRHFRTSHRQGAASPHAASSCHLLSSPRHCNQGDDRPRALAVRAVAGAIARRHVLFFLAGPALGAATITAVSASYRRLRVTDNTASVSLFSSIRNSPLSPQYAATPASRGHRGQLAVALHYPAHDAAHPTVSEEDDVRSTPIVSLDAAASIRCIVGASYWGFTSLDSGGRVTEAFATISDPKKERTYQLRKHGWVSVAPTMEETIIVGDDLMMGPPSPIIPPEIASHVLEGLQINDVEPFCQDEIILYQECAAKRDKELRRKLFDSERKLGLSMPLGDAKERAANLEAEIKTLERRMILASGVEGMEGFRQRWSLHGRIEDTKYSFFSS
ncbi:hypothetical protein ZIOFF_055095 [Zingiber officinale]|uniref:DUF7803 domain-containing protein n=1 Tax=Zingiber officinale TaxID=94328 RepID=A0A8J5FEI5_ZINOF|nr:hypothetical protein ZIOFF_055095 [Zingiber officinale]